MSVPALGQTYFQPDVYGYGMPSGSTMFVYLDPGNGQSSQHIRVGIMDFHSWNNETVGASGYMPQGRSDSYSNPRQDWTRNGYSPPPYTPNHGGYRTTRQRHYYGY
jgi:hypothetical protein